MRRRRLLGLIAEGNEAAFEEFYHEFLDKLYGYLRIRFSDENSIKDIIQEVFIAVWKNSNTFSGKYPVSAWFFGIARNKVNDVLRDKYSIVEEPCIFDEEQYAIEDFSDRLFEDIAFKEKFDTLPAASRELVYMVFNLDMSYREVSKVLEIPEGTVKSRMYRIKNAIRKLLVEGG